MVVELDIRKEIFIIKVDLFLVGYYGIFYK